MKRYHLLKDNEWKMVRIVSKKDKVPSLKTLLCMREFYEDHFSKGHSWIIFDLDEGIVRSSLGEYSYNFGKLNRIS